MKIRIFRRLEDDVYRVTLQTEDWSERDIRLMEKYGEPEIDIGGDIYADGGSGSGDTPLFTLDTALYGIKTGSPFTYNFDFRDYADAETRALAWQATMTQRIQTALATLRSNADAFTGEEVVNV
jgi:hypothetical protein